MILLSDLRLQNRTFPIPQRLRGAFALLTGCFLTDVTESWSQSLNTPTSAGISAIGATLGGNILSNNGAALTQRGVVYALTSANPDPQRGGPGVTELNALTEATGLFTQPVNGLTPETNYSFKAYATNARGTGYTESATFRTTANHLPVLALEAAGLKATAGLLTGRSWHTATLLADGTVLVAGGAGAGRPAINSCELYHPPTGQWTPSGGLLRARGQHTAAVLADGRVLVAGGRDPDFNLCTTAEVYDPAMHRWTATINHPAARTGHTATLLEDGRVLIAGGYDDAGVSSAELYNPVTNRWTPTGSLPLARHHHSAIKLTDGRILVMGGADRGIADGEGGQYDMGETYAAATGSWTASHFIHPLLYDASLTVLANGDLFLIGGFLSDGTSLANATVYNPLNGSGESSWTGRLVEGRSGHTATLLADGRVLVTGGGHFEGLRGTQILNSMELYNPATRVWITTAQMAEPRMGHTATRLPDGKVLITGGDAMGSAELFDPMAIATASAGEPGPAMMSGNFADKEGHENIVLSASSGTITKDDERGTWQWSWNWMEQPLDGPASSTITITATDSLNGIATLGFPFMVSNLAPLAGIDAQGSAESGTPVSFTLSASDPSPLDSAAGFAWKLDFGDGTPVETTAAGASGFLTRSHAFTGGGTFSVEATATDKDGRVSSISVFQILITGPTALQNWRQRYFGSTANFDQAEDFYDADKDGLVNLIEFAFGQDPQSGASAQLPAARLIGDQLVVSFDQPPGVSGSVLYGAEYSTTLLPTGWTPLPDQGTGGRHTFGMPIANQVPGFIRLTIKPL